MDVKDFATTPLEYQQYKNVLMQRGLPKSAVDAIFDPYLITSDKNVVHAAVTVQYRIQDPEAFLMSVSHSELTAPTLVAEREQMLRRVALHALIRVMADTTIDNALYQGRQDLANRLTAATQSEAHELNLGVSVERVNVPELRWPAILDDKFSMASQAHSQAEQARLNAQSYAESLRTNTQTGVAAQIRSAAQSYKDKVTKSAQGEADRFTLVYERYQVAPDLTRLSIYADTMNAIFDGVARTVFVQRGQKAWLPLDPIEDKLQKAPAGGASPPPSGG
jgi:membrane protease subunit HflK